MRAEVSSAVATAQRNRGVHKVATSSSKYRLDPSIFPGLRVGETSIPHFMDARVARWLLSNEESEGKSIIRQLKFDPHIQSVLAHLHTLYPFLVETLDNHGPACFFRLLIYVSIHGTQPNNPAHEQELSGILQQAKQRGLLAILATSAMFLLILKRRGALGSVFRLLSRQRRYVRHVAMQQPTAEKPVLSSPGNDETKPTPPTTSSTSQLLASVLQARVELDQALAATSR